MGDKQLGFSNYEQTTTKLLHGDETVVCADSGYQGIEKREEMKGKAIGFRVAMRPGKRRALGGLAASQMVPLHSDGPLVPRTR